MNGLNAYGVSHKQTGGGKGDKAAEINNELNAYAAYAVVNDLFKIYILTSGAFSSSVLYNL